MAGSGVRGGAGRGGNPKARPRTARASRRHAFKNPAKADFTPKLQALRDRLVEGTREVSTYFQFTASGMPVEIQGAQTGAEKAFSERLISGIREIAQTAPQEERAVLHSQAFKFLGGIEPSLLPESHFNTGAFGPFKSHKSRGIGIARQAISSGAKNARLYCLKMLAGLPKRAAQYASVNPFEPEILESRLLPEVSDAVRKALNEQKIPFIKIRSHKWSDRELGAIKAKARAHAMFAFREMLDETHPERVPELLKGIIEACSRKKTQKPFEEEFFDYWRKNYGSEEGFHRSPLEAAAIEARDTLRREVQLQIEIMPGRRSGEANQ
ncbi:MAG: hypothetical protein V1493_05810 [Candidatus Diapherotrites archaeon]